MGDQLSREYSMLAADISKLMYGYIHPNTRGFLYSKAKEAFIRNYGEENYTTAVNADMEHLLSILGIPSIPVLIANEDAWSEWVVWISGIFNPNNSEADKIEYLKYLGKKLAHYVARIDLQVTEDTFPSMESVKKLLCERYSIVDRVYILDYPKPSSLGARSRSREDRVTKVLEYLLDVTVGSIHTTIPLVSSYYRVDETVIHLLYDFAISFTSECPGDEYKNDLNDLIRYLDQTRHGECVLSVKPIEENKSMYTFNAAQKEAKRFLAEELTEGERNGVYYNLPHPTLTDRYLLGVANMGMPGSISVITVEQYMRISNKAMRGDISDIDIDLMYDSSLPKVDARKVRSVFGQIAFALTVTFASSSNVLMFIASVDKQCLENRKDGMDSEQRESTSKVIADILQGVTGTYSHKSYCGTLTHDKVSGEFYKQFRRMVYVINQLLYCTKEPKRNRVTAFIEISNTFYRLFGSYIDPIVNPVDVDIEDTLPDGLQCIVDEEARHTLEFLKSSKAISITDEYLESQIVKSEYHRVEGTMYTLCNITLKNGMIITGSSACLSPKKYSKDTGKTVARQDAKDKLYQLYGFACKQKAFELSDDCKAEDVIPCQFD